MPLIKPQLYYSTAIRSLKRPYATVDGATIVTKPPRPPIPAVEQESSMERQILAALSQADPTRSWPNLPELFEQYINHSGNVLDSSLPYEPSPAVDRKTNFDATVEESAVSMIAHCAHVGDKHRFTFSSGFGLEGSGHRQGESLVLTCAHTLEEAIVFLLVFFLEE